MLEPRRVLAPERGGGRETTWRELLGLILTTPPTRTREKMSEALLAIAEATKRGHVDREEADLLLLTIGAVFIEEELNKATARLFVPMGYRTHRVRSAEAGARILQNA